jgi:hypothetical protein
MAGVYRDMQSNVSIPRYVRSMESQHPVGKMPEWARATHTIVKDLEKGEQRINKYHKGFDKDLTVCVNERARPVEDMMKQCSIYDPRYHLDDLLGETQITEMNNNQKIHDAAMPDRREDVEGRHVFHPFPPLKIHRPNARGPFGFYVTLPPLGAGETIPDYYTRVFNISPGKPTPYEFHSQINLGAMLEELTGQKDIQAIIPYRITAEVVNLDINFPLEVIVSASPAVQGGSTNYYQANENNVYNRSTFQQERYSEEDKKKAGVGNQEWSTVRTMMHKYTVDEVPQNRGNFTGAKWVKQLKKDDNSEYENAGSSSIRKGPLEKVYNVISPYCDKKQIIYDQTQEFNDADFSRWITYPPRKVFDALTTGDNAHTEIVSVNVGGSVVSVPCYFLNVVNEPKTQNILTVIWLEHRDEAVEYMQSIGVDKAFVDAVYTGTSQAALASWKTDTPIVPTQEEKRLVAPAALLQYFCAKIFQTFGPQQKIMPTGPGTNLTVTLRPQQETLGIEKGKKWDRAPTVQLLISVLADIPVFDKSYDFKEQAKALTFFEDVYNKGVTLAAGQTFKTTGDPYLASVASSSSSM